ncbi:MAG: copper resistance protein B [Ferruginibacter sp.]
MRTIKITALAFVLALALVSQVQAEDMGHDMAKEHGGQTFHMFRLETDYGGSRDGAIGTWDLDGWIGTDENKLWIKSEGDQKKGTLEDTEFWALYSRNISTFWDAQAGIRQDTKPTSLTYATFGFIGLAPYWFETEAHLFISNKGDVSARLREENDFLITQKLILQPYAELNLYAQDVSARGVGAGLSEGKIGLQTRYEFKRKFAPYINVEYGRKFGETSSIAESNGENNDELIGAVGLRLMF